MDIAGTLKDAVDSGAVPGVAAAAATYKGVIFEGGAGGLKPDGVIVFQATNRFIDLLPVVRGLAAEFGLQAVNVADLPDGAEGAEYWYSSTDQVIVTRNVALLSWPALAEGSEEIADKGLPVFTDAHHNLLRILK